LYGYELFDDRKYEVYTMNLLKYRILLDNKMDDFARENYEEMIDLDNAEELNEIMDINQLFLEESRELAEI
jgi:hypothetical protein